jgi:ElaB/YqjD/DUF883 family membrane-anchored ribosome-binding protein
MNPNSPSGQSTGTGISSSGTTSTLGETSIGTGRDTYSETSGTTGTIGTTGRRIGASLKTELSNLKSDLDTLLGRADTMSDTELSQEHARLMAKFMSVKSAARGVAAQANQQFNRGVDITTDYVKDKPLQSIAVASGVGLALGLLFGRR